MSEFESCYLFCSGLIASITFKFFEIAGIIDPEVLANWHGSDSHRRCLGCSSLKSTLRQLEDPHHQSYDRCLGAHSASKMVSQTNCFLLRPAKNHPFPSLRLLSEFSFSLSQISFNS